MEIERLIDLLEDRSLTENQKDCIVLHDTTCNCNHENGECKWYTEMKVDVRGGKIIEEHSWRASAHKKWMRELQKFRAQTAPKRAGAEQIWRHDVKPKHN
jgi:hypothetical protein